MVDLLGEVPRAGSGRSKKLTEVARWNYGEPGQTGGAARCELCKIKLRDLSFTTGEVFEEGTCYNAIAERREVKTVCAYPAPPLSPRAAIYWKLWQRTYGQTNVAGMDAIPLGRSLTDVESACRGLGIPYDDWTLTTFQTIEAIWLSQLAEKRERERKK